MITTSVEQVAQELLKGNIVAIPTETVYGLAGNALDDHAIKKIFEKKGRPLNNPLIAHIHSLSQVENLVENFNDDAKMLAQHFWPGPLTLVLKKKEGISSLLSAGQPTIAIRMPNHPLTLKLLKQLPFPLAAPSANPYMRISPTSAMHVENYFENLLILDGGSCSKGIESTIIGFENEKPIIYRLGSITREELELVLKKKVYEMMEKSEVKVPGMHKKHYSPQTNCVLSFNVEETIKKYPRNKIGVLQFSHHNFLDENLVVLKLSADESFEDAAQNLYDALHQLDQLKLDVIILEALPDIGLGKSINDRLRRASS